MNLLFGPSLLYVPNILLSDSWVYAEFPVWLYLLVSSLLNVFIDDLTTSYYSPFAILEEWQNCEPNHPRLIYFIEIYESSSTESTLWDS